jgi:hypothetical protein
MHLRTLGIAVVIAAAGSFGHPRPVVGQDWERLVRIGVEDGVDEYTFGRLVSVTFLPNGRIVVLDALARKVRTYERTGAHVFSYGSEGEGPGEFRIPVGLTVTADAVLVLDFQQRRLVSFAHDGTYQETLQLPDNVSRVDRAVPLRDGKWIGQDAFDGYDAIRLNAGEIRADEAGLRRLLFFDEAGVDTIARFRPGWIFWYDMAGSSFGPVRHSLPSEELWTVAGDSLVATVDAVRGIIRWWKARAGSLHRVAERHLDLRPQAADLGVLDSISRDVKQRHPRFQEIGFIAPRFQPYFSSAVIDDQGSVWLRDADSAWQPDGRATYRVVSMVGGGLSDVSLPPGFVPTAIVGDVFLGIVRDELDVEYVELYRRVR